MPIFSAVSSRVILNEKISKRMLWTIIFALTGVLLISYGSSQDKSTSIYGDLCAVGCAASYGIALTYARKSKAKSMIPVTPFALFMSGIVFLPWASPFIFEGLDAQYALFHNLLIAASTCLIVLGPRYIPSAEVALLILGESILAPILIWLVIGEYPGTWALIGGLIVLMTLFTSNLIALIYQKTK
jgi:drug/metabolite transporter (DMT)-like permease